MWIALIIIIVLILVVIALYNDLVSLRLRVKNAWSQIVVQLQRRFDLIPNLVETVKGYMGHESDVLTKTIMAVSENYPELKASANFSQLQEELQNTENKISFTRQFYNDTATRYNTKIQVVPSNIIASMFHFEPEQLFEAESQEARKNVKVDFNK